MTHQHDPLVGSLRALPVRTAPQQLTDRLRVMASRESLRRRHHQSIRSLATWWAGSLALWFNNLMRPVALPVTGGLISAVILFALMAPGLFSQRRISGDIPSPLFTQPTVQSSLSFLEGDEDMVIDVWTDETGRVVNYRIPRGQHWASNPALVRTVEQTLLCTRFTPATSWGQAASGQTRITLRRSQMEVRG